MKKLNLISLAFSGVLILSLIAVSCKKNDPDTKPDTQSVDDNSDADSQFDNVLSTVEDVVNSNRDNMDKTGGNNFVDTCATVTLDTAYSSNGAKGRITVDFGTTNCTGDDGKNRRGKIYIDYTGKYQTVGTVITTTFDNYYVNDNKIEGTHVATRTNDSTVKVEVTNAKITWTDATTTLWEATKTRVWSEGRSTLFVFSDDVHTVNGTASGTNRKGETFTATITDVQHKISCWIQGIFVPASGTIEVTPTGKDARTINFGNGTCDKTVTLTVNGKDYEHTFK